ncbi:MAG: hypothetical protein RJA57_1589 [Bacteroidota bacterium]|jgi:flagellum-specific peptidoglycan hydrolase FlgJ
MVGHKVTDLAETGFVSLPGSTMAIATTTAPTRKAWPLSLLLFLSIAGSAQSTGFVKKFQPLADSLSLAYGIPTAVILGVSIIESGSGTSRNCRLLHNYFGIVGRNALLRTHGIRSRYRQYADATASFTDFCRVISRKKFYPRLKGNPDHRLWTEAISKAGYSEVPAVWRQRVNDAIRKNKLATLAPHPES